MKIHERKIYSQAGQDGVLEHILGTIGPAYSFFVEFGTVDGEHISNTAHLRLDCGWKGLLLDKEPTSPLVHKEFITAESIEAIFYKYQVPTWFDYLSIDIDGNDYWVWKAIQQYRPQVVSIEFNGNFRHDESFTMAYNPDHVWDGTSYYGASLQALWRLGNSKGYSLVHIVDNLDAFFVREDCLAGIIPRTPAELLPQPIPSFEPKPGALWVPVL